MPRGEPPGDLPLPFPCGCERDGLRSRFPFPFPLLDDLVRVVERELECPPEDGRVEDERPRPFPFRGELGRPFPFPLLLPRCGVLPRCLPPLFPPFDLGGRGEGLGEALCVFFLTDPF